MRVAIWEKQKGLEGLITELSLLRARRRDVPNSWFKRACRRNCVSTHDAKRYLRTYGLVNGETFPLGNSTPRFEWDTYDGWKNKGRHVIRGAHSFARDMETGEAVFIEWQTLPFSSLTPNLSRES